MTRYKLKNWRAYLDRYLQKGAQGLAGQVGVTCVRSELSATYLPKDGMPQDLGLLSCRVVTDAGVAFLADDWFDASGEITNMNFHDSGTGVTAEAVGQTDLVTLAGPTTRATGTKTNPTNPVVRSVATITYSGTLAITEHGLFSSATRGVGTMWDRSVFSAINVASGDAIQFTYDCTITSGG